MSELSEKIRQILVEQLQIEAEKVSNGAKLIDDLDIDSLDIVELTVKLENTFEIDLPEEDMSSLVNVRDLIAIVSERHRPPFTF